MNDKQQFIADLYPAARKVAQETGWGQRQLQGTNNLFNIKAHGDWDGPVKTMIRAIAFLTMTVLIGACKATPQQSTSDARPAAASPTPASTSTMPVCPSLNFDSFLKAFVDDVELQKAFTAEPLESQTIDAMAEPEPALVTKVKTATELEFPLIPSGQKQAGEGLKMRQSLLENGDIKVTLAKEDTDYQMSFYFKKNGCWKLIRMRNDSL